MRVKTLKFVLFTASMTEYHKVDSLIDSTHRILHITGETRLVTNIQSEWNTHSDTLATGKDRPCASITGHAHSRSKAAPRSAYKVYQLQKETVAPPSE